MKKAKTKRKFNLKFASMLLIPIVGISLIVPVFAFNKAYILNRVNLWTTYDNALDNSIALGIAPDFDTTSSAGRINYGEYLKSFTNDDITKYVNIDVMDGNEINRIPIEKLKLETIVLNEWMKGDSYKFNDVVNNLAWTSMGDSVDSKYNEPMVTGGWTYNTQNSIDKAFLMQAKDFDAIYPGNEFYLRAEEIIKKDKERIININNSSFDFSNITIGLISGTNDAANISNSFSFFSPYVYPMFYAKGEKNEKGLGMNFPEPLNHEFLNITHYRESQIVGDTSRQLLQQFRGKFDYLIYTSPDTSLYTKDDVLKSEIVSLLKEPLKANENIEFGKRGKWYTSAWGIIGKRQLLTYMIEFLNSNNKDENGNDLIIDDESFIWESTPPKELRRLRKDEAK